MHIYGSSRLGMEMEGIKVYESGAEMNPTTEEMEISGTNCIVVESNHVFSQELGDKRFELANHLGNVMVVLSDKRIAQYSGDALASYTAEVMMATDYYPFGMVMSGRSFTSTETYRFGYQNQEEDQEFWDGAVSYKYRIEDPRLGRFFSVDPLEAKYAYYSPYQFSGNRPIDCVELEGLEPAKNHEITSDDFDFKCAAADVCVINDNAQNENTKVNGENFSRESGGLTLNGTYSDGQVSGALSAKTENGITYVSDTKHASAEEGNMWVHYDGVFLVNEDQAEGCPDYNLFVTTALLNNFACGIGPENYVFPTNGIISNSLRNAAVVQRAINQVLENDLNFFRQQISYDGKDLVTSTARYGTINNVEGMLGSATITITRSEECMYINVFNMTSLTSGGLTKLLPGIDQSTSNVRDPDKTNTNYGNISQNFSFTIPLK